MMGYDRLKKGVGSQRGKYASSRNKEEERRDGIKERKGRREGRERVRQKQKMVTGEE